MVCCCNFGKTQSLVFLPPCFQQRCGLHWQKGYLNQFPRETNCTVKIIVSIGIAPCIICHQNHIHQKQSFKHRPHSSFHQFHHYLGDAGGESDLHVLSQLQTPIEATRFLKSDPSSSSVFKDRLHSLQL